MFLLRKLEVKKGCRVAASSIKRGSISASRFEGWGARLTIINQAKKRSWKSGWKLVSRRLG